MLFRSPPDHHAPESAVFAAQIRCLLSVKNRSAFRIFYQIKGNEVRVFAIMRPSPDFMNPEDESETAPQHEGSKVLNHLLKLADLI